MRKENYWNYVCLALILCGACAGCACISPMQKSTVTEQPRLVVTPEPSTARVSPSQAAFGSQTGMTTTNLDYGLTLSYPVTWRKEEPGSTEFRDYGRSVINIANFYSPAITSDRAVAASPNPDTLTYTMLSVDIDPAATSDFERYFNLAVLAVTDAYPAATITKRNVQLKISVTGTFAGYKSYELDFDTDDMRGKYIFTNAGGTVYIFAFRNPSPYSKEVEDIYKSIIITPAG